MYFGFGKSFDKNTERNKYMRNSYIGAVAAIKPWLIVLIVVLVLIIAAIIALYFLGKKAQKKQAQGDTPG